MKSNWSHVRGLILLCLMIGVLAALLLTGCNAISSALQAGESNRSDQGGGSPAEAMMTPPVIENSAQTAATASPSPVSRALLPIISELMAKGGSASFDPSAALTTETSAQLASANTTFVSQPGTPVRIPNFVYSNLGCSWMGIGGQVFDGNQTPVSGLIVQVTGYLNGQDILLLALTGTEDALGPGGYLITLANTPIRSERPIYIQIFDQAGQAVSDKASIWTSPYCEENMILANFTQVVFDQIFFVPFVPRR